MEEFVRQSFVLQIEGRYRQWDVIAALDNGCVVLSHEIMHSANFGNTNRWKEAFIRNYLHDVWLHPIRDALELKSVSRDSILEYKTETTRDYIFILSKDEHTEWRANIPLKSTPYWLRTSYGHLHTPYAWIVSSDGHHLGEAVHSSGIGVVPAMYLSEKAIRALVGTIKPVDPEKYEKPPTRKKTLF
ncbi:MAG: hypothetical protein J5819_07245 [Eubacterium sp.]|nr:hypothetical protein [Eubacterium sp.]